MPQTDAPILEFCERSVMRLGGEAQQFWMGRQRPITQQRFCVEDLQNLLCIRLPVGGAMHVATRFEATYQFGYQRRLNQSALVVLGLVPGVRKKDVNPVQTLVGQHVVNHLHRVVDADANVGNLMFANTFEQCTHTGFMDFTAQKSCCRKDLCNLRRRFAHAKADFQHYGVILGCQWACNARAISEGRFQINSGLLVGQYELRTQFAKRPRLTGSGSPGAFDKTLDRAHEWLIAIRNSSLRYARRDVGQHGLIRAQIGNAGVLSVPSGRVDHGLKGVIMISHTMLRERAQAVKTFEWTPLFETGLAEVDAQHRRLVDLLNSLSDQIDSASPARVDDLLKALAQYTVYHFSYEEGLMAEVGLDARHIEGHCAVHARFVDQVQSWMATRQAEGQLSPDQLIDYLANWLIFHILGEDQSMGRQVLAIQSGRDKEQVWREDSPSDDPRTVILLNALHRLYSDLIERNERLVTTQEALKSLNASLEQRVAQRTADLEAANQHLQEERQRVIETEKMASLGRMVAGFAHEVNTPIGIAVGAVSHVEETVHCFEGLLQGDEVSEQQIAGSLAALIESSALAMSNLHRAASLVQSFKRTAVDQVSEIQRDFSLAQLIDDVISTMRPLFRGAQIVFEVTCSPSLRLRAIPGAWTQILTNLCTNAHKHAFAEGKRAGAIHIEVRQTPSHVVLSFCDNGAGMEPEHVGKVFEPFFTTRRNDGGSGLGLYISYNLVTQTLGGALQCHSMLGQGTEFVLSVPSLVVIEQEAMS